MSSLRQTLLRVPAASATLAVRPEAAHVPRRDLGTGETLGLGFGELPGSLVAVGTRSPTASVTVRDLRALAEERHERLILIPHIAELQEIAHVSESEAVRSAMTQIGTLLRRTG